jgi:hypothetical protein
MPSADLVTGELGRRGFVVAEHRLGVDTVTEARRQIGDLLASVGWGTGFINGEHPRHWLTAAGRRPR